MALIPLAGRSHVLGQLFDVLPPYCGKAGLQVCQFLVRQENILVTAIGAGALILSILYPHIFVLRTNQSQPQQKGAESERRIIPDGRFPELRVLLVDAQRRDRHSQNDVGFRFTRVQRRVEQSPLNCAMVEHGMQVQGVIPTLVVVIVAAVPPAIPAILQLIHTRTAGQLADFFQNRLIHRLTVAVDAGRVDFECCK